MKYMLLIYGAESDWTPEERMKCMEESVALSHELNDKGQFLGASPLHPVAMATSIRNEGSRKLVTDGPFAETHEQLGGYYLIDVPDLDAAIEVAKRLPGGRKGTVEIRPIFQLEGIPNPSR